METTLIVISVLLAGVAVYHRLRSISRERLDRKQEGVGLLIAIRLFGVLSIAQIVVFLRNPLAWPWARVDLPDPVRWAGVVLYGAAAFWLGWMFVSLGRNLTDTVVTRRDAEFVEQGPYRFVRNPMYTGLLILGLGFGLAMENWSTPVSSLMTFLLLARRTRIEEKFLLERFGAQYRDYMQRVGRFLPGLGKRSLVRS